MRGEAPARDDDIDPDLVVSSWRPGEDLDEPDPPWAPTKNGRGAPMPQIPPGEPVVLADCHLNYGFVLTEIGLAILTEREIFGEEIRQTAPKRRKGAAFISDFRDLKPGDLVVHVDHGVARYLGLARPPGSPRDFMLLQYADDARLYVPVDRLDLVLREVAKEAEDEGPMERHSWLSIAFGIRSAVVDELNLRRRDPDHHNFTRSSASNPIEITASPYITG